MLIARTDSSLIGKWWWTVDRLLLSAILTLALSGAFLVATASPAVAELLNLSSFHFINKHLVFLVVALTIMIGISLFSDKNIRRIALIGLLCSLVAVTLTLFIGSSAKGATRWISLFGFSLQPSEFLKPCFAVFSAWLLAQKIENNAKNNYLILGGVYCVIVVLFLSQPDFGMTILTSLMLGAQIFLAGLPLSFMVIGGGGLGCLALWAYFNLPHVTSRIDRFLDPASGDTFQIRKSLDSFANGGFFGVGPAEGVTKMHLPDAHADFIFAVSGEEMGLLLTLMLIGLFVFIMSRTIMKTIKSGDLFTVLSIGGLITLFVIQTMIHMMSSLHMIPTKGMTLPFVSYGGSSLISMGITFGFILGLTRKKPNFSGIKAIRPLYEKSLSKSMPISGKVS